MDDSIRMQILDSIDHVSGQYSDLVFFECFVFFDDFHEIASWTEIDNHPKMVSSFIPIVKSQDVRMD